MQIQGKYTFSGGIFPHLSQTFIQYIMNVYQFLSMLVFFLQFLLFEFVNYFPPPCLDVNLRVNNDGKREPIISHRTLCKLYALSVEASFQALLTNDKIVSFGVLRSNLQFEVTTSYCYNLER